MELDAATVLEEAADLLLLEGRCPNRLYGNNGERCVMAALHDARRRLDPSKSFIDTMNNPEWLALKAHIAEATDCLNPVDWNQVTEDDFEVIDTLRHVAKDLRNEAG